MFGPSPLYACNGDSGAGWIVLPLGGLRQRRYAYSLYGGLKGGTRCVFTSIRTRLFKRAAKFFMATGSLGNALNCFS